MNIVKDPNTNQKRVSMFTNPVGLEAASTVNGSSSGVALYGDEIWDYMCANYEGFTIKEIALHLTKKYLLAERTAYNYTQSFFAYYKAVPGEFGGPASKLTKADGDFWCLIDQPEPQA